MHWNIENCTKIVEIISFKMELCCNTTPQTYLILRYADNQTFAEIRKKIQKVIKK